MSKSLLLKVSSAFMVDGLIAKAGEIVEVSESEAKNLLHRGKATLANAPTPTEPETTKSIEISLKPPKKGK